MKIIILFLIAVIFDAAGDALNDSHRKGIGHALQAIFVGLLLMSPFFIDVALNSWGWYLASYICLRIALFDPIYNITRGLKWNFIGTTSLWDKTRMAFNPPASGEIFGRAIFLAAGIFMIINELLKIA